MRLALSRNLIATAPRRWEAQYRDTTDEKKQAITARLNALDVATATAAEVAEIIGNKSWSYFTCDECSQPVEKVVEIGEYERVVTLCTSCLRAASALGAVVL
jgi:hypothetical protein